MCKSSGKEIKSYSGIQINRVFYIHLQLECTTMQDCRNHGTVEITIRVMPEVPFECVEINCLSKCMRFLVDNDGYLTLLDRLYFSCLDEDNNSIETFFDDGVVFDLTKYGWNEELSYRFKNEGVCTVFFTSYFNI